MDENQLKKFGFRVRQKREELNLDRKEVAAQLDVHTKTYSKWENGQAEPTLGKALRLSEILNTSVAELTGENAVNINNAFNNNTHTQEGESNTVNYFVYFDREIFDDMSKRFVFLETTISKVLEQNNTLLTKIVSGE